MGLLVPTPVSVPADPRHAIEHQIAMPADINSLLHRSCMDCHSSRTRWPWYSRLLPVSFFLQRDIVRASHAMNFSEWTVQNGRTPGSAAAALLAACEDVRTGRMPPAPYQLMHPRAGFSPEEATRLCSWTREEVSRLMAARRKITRTPSQR